MIPRSPSRGRGAGRPKRSLGQNFLVDPNTQRAIVRALGAGGSAQVLEIGPGRGALTEHLAGGVDRLVCVELDDALAAALRERFADDPTVEIVTADFLQTTRTSVGLADGDLHVIGNLPYNRTSPMLFHILSDAWRPHHALVMVQREVAERILAPPGSRTYGALSIGVQVLAEVESVMKVSRKAFRPVPDIESSVIRLRPHAPKRLSAAEERALRVLTRVAFARRRKQFQRILRDAPEYRLDEAGVAGIEARLGIDLRGRPETFDPETFVALSRALAS